MRRSNAFGDGGSFVKEGVPSSGLLARISDSGPGQEGSGDSKMQAYNFRFADSS